MKDGIGGKWRSFDRFIRETPVSPQPSVNGKLHQKEERVNRSEKNAGGAGLTILGGAGSRSRRLHSQKYGEIFRKE
jgi:hypothetical protein